MAVNWTPAELVASMNKPRVGIDACWSVDEIKAATSELLLKWFKENTAQVKLYLATMQQILNYEGR